MEPLYRFSQDNELGTVKLDKNLVFDLNWWRTIYIYICTYVVHSVANRDKQEVCVSFFRTKESGMLSLLVTRG